MKLDQLKYRPIVFWVPFTAILLIWLVYYLDWRFYLGWRDYGIQPRKISGLKGVFFSPLLHGSVKHLFNNSLALAMLLPLICYYYFNNWKTIISYGVLFAGLGTWIIAESGNHIGASGLVYVLTSYLFFTGIRSKQYKLMAVSLVVVLIYGSSVWYMFPDIEQGISWQGHLSGFLVGLILSFILQKPQFEPIYTYEWQKPDFDESKDEFIRNFDKNGNFRPLPLLRIDDMGYVYNDSFHYKLNNNLTIKTTLRQSYEFYV